MIKLILTDLDNTLLRSDKSISAYTLQILTECRKRGILIGFASARAESASARFIEAVKPDVFISNGGASVRAGGHTIHKELMSVETVETILSMCAGYTRGGITVEAEDGYYCNFIPEDPDRRAAAQYTDFLNFRKRAYKITAELENEDWAYQIIRACPDCTTLRFSGEIWQRFAAEGANKETALKTLADFLRIDTCEIAAFGDDNNDLEMLKMSGMGIAVANAVAKVREAANHVTQSNDEDGVARFIAEHILSYTSVL